MPPHVARKLITDSTFSRSQGQKLTFSIDPRHVRFFPKQGISAGHQDAKSMASAA